MGATFSKGYSFGAVETVTAAKLSALVDDATITGIVNAEIANNTIQSGKIADVSGAKFTNLANTSAGAGKFPMANLPADTDGTLAANSDIKLATQKATKTYADAVNTNANTKISKTTAGEIAAMTEKTTLHDDDLVLIEDSEASNAKKKAKRSNLLYPRVTQDNASGTNITLGSTETTIVSKAKTITAGNTVMLMASGWLQEGGGGTINLYLKHGTTTAQTLQIDISTLYSGAKKKSFSLCAIVTELSGEVTFKVSGIRGYTGDKAMNTNLIILEF